MVLAAGLGTRMRPLTDKVPKPLVQLDGKPLVDHVLDQLVLAGVDKAVVNVHYMAEQIENHLADRTSPQITISDERDVLLDTGGGVARALPLLGSEPFYIHNSDSVWIEGTTPCLEKMAETWNPDVMDTLFLLAPVEQTLGYGGKGDFLMHDDGTVERRGERDSVAFVFAGVSIAHLRLFAECPDGKFSLNLLWDRAIAAGRAFGVRHEGTWMHVGTPQAVDEAGELLRRERV